MTIQDTARGIWAFAALFELAGHGVVLFDREGRIEAFNQTAAALTGHQPEDALGRTMDWLHADDAEPWPPGALELAARGERVRHRGWRRRDGGSRYWCEATLLALHDGDGELRGFAEAFDDRLRSADRTLREGPALFERALRTAPIGLAAQDADLRYTWAPLGAEALGGRPGIDPVGHADEDLYAATAAARLTALKRQVLDTNAGVRAELAVEGEEATRHFDMTLEPIRDQDGASIGVSTVAFEITQRKRIEQEAERARARLAEAEQMAHMGSWEWDVPGNHVVWSDGLCAIYGIEPADFGSRYEPGPERVHPDDRERVDAAVRQSIATCEPLDLEYRILRPDGRVRRVRGRAEVIADSDGRPIRMAGTVQDITEMRTTADELSETAARLGRHAAQLHGLAMDPDDGGEDLSRLLTPRQLEILELVGQGLSNAEIAQRLFLGESTVKWHVRKVLRALGVANRAQAVARHHAARRNGG